MINLAQISTAVTECFGLEVSVTNEDITEGQKIIIRSEYIEHCEPTLYKSAERIDNRSVF